MSIMEVNAKIFKALGDETRLKIVDILLGGEKCVCEIVPATGRKQSTVSIQLAKLEDAGIIESRREGRCMNYRISNKKVKDIIEILK